jgi:tetratricopeptide (TPR) repeat protein
MSTSNFLANSLKILKLKKDSTIPEVTTAYLQLTGAARFRKIFIMNEELTREFIKYHEAWVIAIRELSNSLKETSAEYYPTGELFSILFNQGLYYLLKDNLLKAGEKLEEAARMSPGDVHTQIYLGIILKKRKNYYAAERYFLKAIKMEGENEYSWFFLAQTYISANKLDKASAALRKVEGLSFYNNEVIAATRDSFRDIERLRLKNSRKSIISRVFKK